MTDRPVIMSAPEVCALLDGRKTMTRRLAWKLRDVGDNHTRLPSPWQRVQPGDRLWVRETIVPSSTGFEYDTPDDDYFDLQELTDEQVEFWNRRAGDDPYSSHKVSPIHMPRWASRLTLVVTATKVERLHEISAFDARAEGVDQHNHSVAWPNGDPGTIGDVSVRNFAALWCSLHGPASWDANPEVVALTFAVHKTNIDQMPKAEAA